MSNIDVESTTIKESDKCKLHLEPRDNDRAGELERGSSRPRSDADLLF